MQQPCVKDERCRLSHPPNCRTQNAGKHPISPNKDHADERNFRWQTLYAILKRLERRCADILRDLGLELEKYNMLCHCCFLIYQCEYSKILSWSAELTAPVMLEKRTNHPQAHSKIFSTNRDTG